MQPGELILLVSMGSLQALSNGKYIVLETYRRNGTPVRTPVWYIETNGIVYVRTGTKTGKMKRLRKNSTLRLSVSNAWGSPKGPWYDAHATVTVNEERQGAMDSLKRKYGLQWRMVGLLHKIRGTPDYSILGIHLDQTET